MVGLDFTLLNSNRIKYPKENEFSSRQVSELTVQVFDFVEYKNGVYFINKVVYSSE